MLGASALGISIVVVAGSFREQRFYHFPLWSSGDIGRCISIYRDTVWAVCTFLPGGYCHLIIVFSSKSKQCIFKYWIPSEGERAACKHHFFSIVELDNKIWKYLLRPLKFHAVPGGLCGFYKYLISLLFFRYLAVRRQGRAQISVRCSY